MLTEHVTLDVIDPLLDIISDLCFSVLPLPHLETIKAAQASAESPPEASAERAATGPQGASEWIVSERGGAVTTGDGGGRPQRRPGHTDVTPVNQSVLPLCLLCHTSATTIELVDHADPDHCMR